MERQKKREKLNFVQLVIAFGCAGYLTVYLNLSQNGGLWIALAIFNYIIFNCVKVKNIFKRYMSNIWFLFFAFATSILLVLGKHIYIGGSIYTALSDTNYILQYSFNDLLAVIILTFEEMWLLAGIIALLHILSEKILVHEAKKIGSWKSFSIAIFVSWIPYLLVHYPGYIVGDAMTSIYQAKGAVPLTNHHPIIYTLFIKMCLMIGEKIKDITFGCAIYTVVQMIYLSIGLGYLLNWIKKKKVSNFFVIISFAIFAFVPFYAQLGIVMWKDPMFSVTVAVWSVMLIEFIEARGRIDNIVRFLIIHFILSVVFCFLRNNGIYIVIAVECIMIVIAIIERGKIKGLYKLVVSNILTILIVSIITGPIYTAYNLNGESVESFGIFLNQMARVVALNGDMSEEDKEFMNELLPLDMYKETYRPCCIDMLKWDENFNETYLEEHKSQFMKSWISMFLKNPICYLEGWELMTFGYWGINQWQLNNDKGNITKANLDAVISWENYGITPHNLLENKFIDLTNVFKTEDASISLAVINWFVLFVAVLFLMKKRYSWIIVLAPSLGNIATLLIASPYAYWQRYGVLQYYLIPIYLVLAMKAVSEDDEDCSRFDKTNTI